MEHPKKVANSKRRKTKHATFDLDFDSESFSDSSDYVENSVNACVISAGMNKQSSDSIVTRVPSTGRHALRADAPKASHN